MSVLALTPHFCMSNHFVHVDECGTIFSWNEVSCSEFKILGGSVGGKLIRGNNCRGVIDLQPMIMRMCRIDLILVIKLLAFMIGNDKNL